MFPIHVNDGTTPIPEDDICYIVAKEGIFLKKKMGIMESIAPVENISILESVTSMARMNIKKIPGGQVAKVIAFFREVYKEYNGEAIILLFYDTEKRIYKIVPPHQKVTSATCDYNKGITIEGMQMIGTIHSHANMSAFHSGTDDTDEEHFDGLHITIGNMCDEDVSITASIVVNGYRFVIQPEDYIERLTKMADIDETVKKPTRRMFKWVEGKMVEDVVANNRYTYSYQKMDKRYKINVSAKYHKVDSNWMSMVEKGTYVHHGYGYLGGLYSGFDEACWGEHYGASLWNKRGILPSLSNVKNGNSPSIKPIEFPPHDINVEDNNDFFPCPSCVFRSHKFLAEQKLEEIDEDEVYKCKKCETIVVDNDDEFMTVICPICKTDEYMVMLEEDELPNNFVDSQKTPNITHHTPGIVEDSDFLTCPTCGNGFHLFADEIRCPFCYSLINEKAEENVNKTYSGEEERIEEAQTDSGAFLSDEDEKINEQALIEATDADQTIKRIPDPIEPQMPIDELPKTNKSILTRFGQYWRKKI